MFSAVELPGSSSSLNAIVVALVALSVAGCSADVTRFNNISFSRAAQSDRSAGGLSPPAARPRREGDLSGEHLLAVLLHSIFDQGLQVWVAEIGDPVDRLGAGAIGNVGMGRIGPHDAGPRARNLDQIAADRYPSDVVRGKIGLRRSRHGWRATYHAGKKTACEYPLSQL
jgi:hypothetical protein